MLVKPHISWRCSLSTMIRNTRYSIIALLLLAGLTHCSEPPATTNPVRAIKLGEFDSITSDKGFNGLVVVMAAWCPPCREELPIMVKVYEKYKKNGIQIVALSIDAEGPKAIQPLINKVGVPFPVYWAGTPALQHYQISGIPLLMVYDKGELVHKLAGSHSRKTIEKIINTLQAKAG